MGISIEDLIGDADVLIYGTTWATNAIVTGTTAKTALLVTEGFPDILVYRQGGKLHPFELHIDPLKPYVPRRLTAEIPERVTAEGEIGTGARRRRGARGVRPSSRGRASRRSPSACSGRSRTRRTRSGWAP